MKIIHTADLHLDSKMNAYLPDDKIKERKSELLTSFVNLCEKAKVRSPVTVTSPPKKLFFIHLMKTGKAIALQEV